MTFEQDFLQVKGITGTEEVFGTVDPVTEEKQDMVPIDVLGTDVGDIQHELEVIEDAREALEAYDNFLTHAGPDGISRQTAAAMYIGLSRIDRQLNQRSDLVASMEDNDLAEVDNRNKMAVAKGVDNKGIAGRGKQLFDKLKEIIAKLIEKIRKAWAFFMNKAKQAGDKAKSVLQGINDWAGPNGVGGGKKIEIPGRVKMFVFKGDKPLPMTDVNALVKYAFIEYPTFLMEQFNQIKASMNSNDAISELETFLAYDGPLPDHWVIEDDGSGYPHANFSGDSNSPGKHRVRDKGAITQAMKAVQTTCDLVNDNIGDNSIMDKLSKSFEELLKTTGNKTDELDNWNRLLKSSVKVSTACAAANNLQKLATFMVHEQTTLALLEVEAD
jgi:hypothetical protein